MRSIFLLIACVLLVVAASASLTVEVNVQYPESIVGAGTTFGLRGSTPLSWDASIFLRSIGNNMWRGSFTLNDTLLNTTYPVFGVDTKVILNESIWQIGCNDRSTFTLDNLPQITVQMYPYFFRTTGSTTVVRNVHSPQLNNTRDVWVYIPPGSVENYIRIEANVLVMQDGQNLEPLWNVNTHLDDLIVGGLMTSVFVVGPYNTADRIAEYTYSVDPQYGGGKGNLYLDFVENTLLPLIQDEFNVDTLQPNLGIMGSSLGGLISCYAGVTRPSTYSSVGCMSSSFWWNNGDFYGTIIPQINISAANSTQQFYVDSGDSGISDDDVTDTSQVATAFIVSGGFELGRNFYWYLDRGGQHNEAYWSARFHHPMQWLYFRDSLNNANGY